jgi:hypothetical protein
MISGMDTGLAAAALSAVFAEADAVLSAREAAITRGEALSLTETVEAMIALTQGLVSAYVATAGVKAPPAAETDILEAFRVLVKGEPTWNAIRDNCRELVYYRNCINMGRRDALPKVPEKMAVRTARHVYLYIKTRCIREGRLAD